MHHIRVGFLSPSLYLGGAEHWLATLATGLHAHGFTITGIAISLPNAVDPHIAAHIDPAIPILHGESHYAPLADASNILINWGETNLSLLGKRRQKLVHCSQGQCLWTCNCIVKALPYITHAVAVSPLAATAFPNPAQVTVIPNSVDPKRCQPDNPRAIIRKHWGAQPYEKLIGFLGRHSDEKNPLAAVYAAKLLGSPYRPVMIGGGHYAQAYRNMARTIHPATILNEPVDNVGNVFSALDVAMFASKWEGCSIALMEAWYCRCPTIATPTGATPHFEALHGKLTVTLPTAHTPRDLITTVLAALAPNNPTIERAHAVVAAHYLNCHMIEQWARYLVKVHSDPMPEPA